MGMQARAVRVGGGCSWCSVLCLLYDLLLFIDLVCVNQEWDRKCAVLQVRVGYMSHCSTLHCP